MSRIVRLLIIHPDAALTAHIAGIAQDLGYDVAVCSRPLQFAESVAVFSPDVLVCPFAAGNFSALHLFEHLSACNRATSLIVLNPSGAEGARLVSRFAEVYGIDCRLLGAAPSLLDLTAVLGEEHVERCGTVAPRTPAAPSARFSDITGTSV